MNQPSMDFLDYLRPNGVFVYNKSLVDSEPDRPDVKALGIPATEVADRLKSEVSTGIADTKMFANAVMFGAFVELCSPKTDDNRVRESLKHFLSGKREELMTLNFLAVTRGRDFVRANPVVDPRGGASFHCPPSWAVQ